MTRSRSAAFLCASIIILWSGSGWGQIKQPNGTAVPVTDNFRRPLNGGPVCYVGGCTPSVRTQKLSSGPDVYVNENISTTNNYAVEPQVFQPLCSTQVRYIYKGGGAAFAIGWYNVNRDDGSPRVTPPLYRFVTGDINQTAADSDINILVPFTDAGGVNLNDNALPMSLDVAVSNIRKSPRYTGGLIGLSLIPKPVSSVACCPGASCLTSCTNAACCSTGSGNATQYHYTEHKWNTHCTACTSTPGGPWYSFLIYRSTVLDNTFYLGFEDLDFRDDPTNGVNGNDLDYDDFVFQFTGLACAGAGQACTDGTRSGACQLGVTDCDTKGTVYCKPLVQPGQNPEVCDGVDNDCNGKIDDNAPCPGGQICDRGRCTSWCSSEFPCSGGQACDNLRCVDAGCVGKTCAAMQVCRAGACVDACAGITCPAPYVCSGGTCLDPCLDPTTGKARVCLDSSGKPDAKKVCVNGACVPTCDCLSCSGAGQACQPATGKCVDSPCANVTCGAGQLCKAGKCVSACDGAVCPAGQVCGAGKCSLPCDGKCSVGQVCQNNACVVPPDLAMSPPDLTPLVPDLACEGSVCTGGAPVLNTSCACRLGGRDPGAPVGVIGAVLLLGLGLSRRRRVH